MIGVYIHIPFCSSICTYCDFCKLYYNKTFVKKYLNSLEEEIKRTYKGEKVKTMYIGGGTPTSLEMDELSKLFDVLKVIDKSNVIEYTIECNIEDLTVEKLKLFKDAGVNRLSIGVQSFNDKIINVLGRHHDKTMAFNKIREAKKMGFDNINIDLIYGIDGQTMKDLKDDINSFLELDIPHISCYSLIVEPHTKLYINSFNEMDEDLNSEMYEYINNELGSNDYHHYEISNYAKDGYESKHNLIYWHNDRYYGFGLGASSYIDNIRYDNTRNLKAYCDGNYVFDKQILNKIETMQNEMILGLRLRTGVNKKIFYEKYHQNINDVFKIDELIKSGQLIDNAESLYIPDSEVFTSNSILLHFLD